MIRTDVLILGAGLAGLSTAYHLERRGRRGRYVLIEKEARIGGVAGSRKVDGFTFDFTGHLLHLHNPYGKRLILDLLKNNVRQLDRKAWIYSHKTFTRYPFQANTYGLPEHVIAECVAGFAKNLYFPRPISPGDTFLERCQRVFGSGISRHFMHPYNLKLWGRQINNLGSDWHDRYIPRPTIDEVLYGALHAQKKFFGYNARFRYPKRGGSQALPDALAARVGAIYRNSPVSAVHLEDKTAVIDGIGEIRYEQLVNTLPLPAFLDLCGRLSPEVRRARTRLIWRDVLNLNIGVKRANISEKHWIYFPEARFPFYRAGFANNFSKSLAPEGCSSMYIETSRSPGQKADYARLERQCLGGLRSAGILKKSDKIAARQWNRIPYAYVIYDKHRASSVESIFRFLDRRGVRSIGRWGGWHYSFMEESILEGKGCAEQLLGLRGRRSEFSRPLKTLK